MRTNALQIIPAKYLGWALLLLVLISASPSLADDPRAAQARLKQAAKKLGDKTKEVVRATKGLERSIDGGLKRLKELEGGLKDYEKNLEEAKKNAEQAAAAAKRALDAARNCQKSEFDRLSKEADSLLKKAEAAEKKAAKLEGDLLDTSQKMSEHLDKLKQMGDQEYKEYQEAAEAARVGGRFAVGVDDFAFHKQGLLDEINWQQQKLDGFNKATNDLFSKMAEIRRAKVGDKSLVDMNLDAAKDLQEGKALRDKGCAPTAAGGFKAPTTALLAPITPAFPPVAKGGESAVADVTVVVNNRQTALICIPPGADAATVAAALGLADYQVIATTATGTIIAAYGDPQTIEAEARKKGIPLCFVEINFCVIKAPLTAFRGHQHKAHPGGIHNHDAPDPPWSWSVTPPEPVVSWGGR